MKRTLILALFLSIFFLAACDGAELTPTPFPATWTPGPALAAQQSFAVEISELLASPDTYADAYVEITGQYQKRPLLICESDSATNPSPATWEISDTTNLTLSAGAYDDALRSLIPDGLTVTVAGYWQQWDGPIGCGKQAEQQTIWFLEVTDIISPSPIVQVTLTPTPIDGSPIFSEDEVTPVGGVTNPDDGSGGVTEPIPTQEDGLPIEATPLPADATATAVSDNNSPTNPSATTTGDNNSQQTATPTATRTNDTDSGTAVPTSISTSNSSSGTPTTTPQTTATSDGSTTNPTSTPETIGQETSTPRSGTEEIIGIDGTISEDEDKIGFGYILPNQNHDWEVNLLNSTSITISLAAGPRINLGFELLDENDMVLTSSNNAPANQIEIIKNFNVNPDNEYYIRVFGNGAEEGNYILLIWGNGDGAVVLDARGYLNYGQTKSDTIPNVDRARHYWFFYGEENDVITVNASTNDAHIMLISMYDANGDYLESDGDELLWVEAEVPNVLLPETSLYALWLEEFDYEMTDYAITITKQ